MSKIKLVLLLIMGLIIIGCFTVLMYYPRSNTQTKINGNANYPVQFTDFDGRKVILNKKPEKIVVLSPAIAKIMIQLGCQKMIIGVSDEVSSIKDLSKIKKVGAYSNIDVETIKNLKPDLVLTSKYVYQSMGDDLTANQSPVAFLEADSYNGIFESIDFISKIFDVSKQGKLIISETKQKVRDIVGQQAIEKKPNILYLQSVEPIFVAGGKTLINDIISMAGGVNSAQDIIGYSEMSSDRLSVQPVDIIVLSSNIGKEYTLDYLKKHEKFRNLDAVKNGKVVRASSEDMFVNPSTDVIKAIEEMKAIINSN